MTNWGLEEHKIQSFNLFEKFTVEDAAQDTKLFKFLNDSRTQFYLLILTFYALFADDYRLLTSPKSLDFLYDIFTILSIASFSAELVVSIFAKVGYFCSYFFWLDLVSTLSLILDIVMIKDFIIEAG